MIIKIKTALLTFAILTWALVQDPCNDNQNHKKLHCSPLHTYMGPCPRPIEQIDITQLGDPHKPLKGLLQLLPQFVEPELCKF